MLLTCQQIKITMRSSIKLTFKRIRTVYIEEWYALFIEAVDVKAKNVAPVNYQGNYNFTNDKD